VSLDELVDRSVSSARSLGLELHTTTERIAS
jgi:hypothetical protein